MRFAFLFSFIVVCVPGQPWPLSPPVSREFTHVANYPYLVRSYRPPKLIELIASKPIVARPEDALVSHLSAWRSGNYGWWLESWDENSAKFWALEQQRRGQSASSWSELRKLENGEPNRVQLLEWIQKGRFIILHYRLINGNGTISGTDRLTAFKISGGMWKATLELGKDPILEHHLSGKTEIEATK